MFKMQAVEKIITHAQLSLIFLSKTQERICVKISLSIQLTSLWPEEGSLLQIESCFLYSLKTLPLAEPDIHADATHDLPLYLRAIHSDKRYFCANIERSLLGYVLPRLGFMNYKDTSHSLHDFSLSQRKFCFL